MPRIHFFKAPLLFDKYECNEAVKEIETALTKCGCPNDKVIVTNFDYQGSVVMQDEFAMFGADHGL